MSFLFSSFRLLLALWCFIIYQDLFAINNKTEKPFVIVITSYNNANWYKQNLDSVMFQDYQNYRVLYFDDASRDNTPDFVESYIKERKKEHLVTLIRQKEWQSQMANHYQAIQMCDDNEIVVHLDGDDSIANNNVLSLLNDIYSQQDVWFTYGQTQTVPHLADWGICYPVPSNVIQVNSFREHGWVYGHLRTFYAWLFKQIKLQDLLYKGTFKLITPSPDGAFVYPLVEMAGKHLRFIPDILHYWNTANATSQFYLARQAQVEIGETIRTKWQKYYPLQNPVIDIKESSSLKADLVLFHTANTSLNSILQCISSIQKNVENLANIYFICRSNSDIYTKKKILDEKFGNFVQILPYEPGMRNFKILFETALAHMHDHIIFGTDDSLAIDRINIATCIERLNKTFAHSFHLKLNKSKAYVHDKALPYIRLSDGILGWQFQQAHYLWLEPTAVRNLYLPEHQLAASNAINKEWKEPYNFRMTLYKKITIMDALNKAHYRTPQELKRVWRKCNEDSFSIDRNIGLCFSEDKFR